MATPKSFIPDNQNLPKSFIPDEPQEKSNFSKGLNVVSRFLDVPSSVVGGAMKGAREAVTGEYKAPQTGLKIRGVDVGEALPPTVVEAGRSLKNLVTGKDYNPVMKELPQTAGIDPNSLAGMALGLAGEVMTPDPLDTLNLGKGVSKITQKLGEKTGKAVENVGESLVVRGLKASPSQQKKFAEKTGKNLSEFMTKNEITSDFVEGSAKKIEELQNSFDELALNSNIKIKGNDLLTRFGKKVDEYAGSVLPELKSKSENIKQVAENLVKKYGDDISLADLTKERRGVDALLKDGQFNLPVEQSNYLRSVRDILQETVQDYTAGMKAGGKDLKQIGLDLRDMFEFQKIAKQQSGIGKGTMPIGLTDLLAIGAGSTHGILGGVGAFAAKRATNDPRVISKTSGVLRAIGSFGQKAAPLAGNSSGYTFEALRRAGRTIPRSASQDR